MTGTVSTALYLQMQQNLPKHRITMLSCTHVFMTRKEKKDMCPSPKDPAWTVPMKVLRSRYARSVRLNLSPVP